MLSDDLRELADELRGVYAASRQGDKREVSRIVSAVQHDMEKIARKIRDIDAAPSKEAQSRAEMAAYRETELTKKAHQISRATFGDGFDPTGWYVYLLWGDDNERPLYVGQSQNILSRLGNHMGNPDRKPHVRRIGLIQCPDERTMDSTENRLIGAYQPTWNIVWTQQWWDKGRVDLYDEPVEEKVKDRFDRIASQVLGAPIHPVDIPKPEQVKERYEQTRSRLRIVGDKNARQNAKKCL